MTHAAVGAMRRNGTAPDNLVLAYSNPGYMRALNVAWIGSRLQNQTFIDFLEVMNQIFTWSFTAEMVFKMIGLGEFIFFSTQRILA